jgi:phosphopantothenoylcysteine decarboxylase/phosphopantothenate--cysteine ligase
MSVLNNKKIVLGVCGGIAAYKTAILVRLLVKKGADVKVIMTPSAKDFVTPLTLSTLSKNEVNSEFYDKNDENAVWNNHVEFALWADFMVIAPATANTLSKMVSGNCDNLLLATYLSSKCPVYFAPAMDLDMYKHDSTKFNFNKLQSFGNILIPAESGELASGLSGEGRMVEPENIVSFIENDLNSKLPLKSKTIVITAGPTHEAIDAVRFIGNHSSGKMGFEIADCAANLGANVILISGPTYCTVKNTNIKLVQVTSAEEMFVASTKYFANTDVFIAAAAVADYRPKFIAAHKIKKTAENLSIELEKTVDILAHLGQIKTTQFLIGFALETENELENAKLKVQNKNLDFIVLNSLQDVGAGFGTDTNKVTFITKKFEVEKMELKSKKEVATDILNKVKTHFNV